MSCVPDIFLFVSQGTAEGSPLLLRAWRGWRVEQPACPHHDTGAWFPSGPSHWPLTGAQEWGMFTMNTTPLTGHFTPACRQRLGRPGPRYHQRHIDTRRQWLWVNRFVVLDKSVWFLFLSLSDLWANPNVVLERAVWVQIHADWSKLVQLLLWPRSSQGQPVSDRLTFTLLFSMFTWNFWFWEFSGCAVGLWSHARFW